MIEPEISQFIKNTAAELGFDLAGVASAAAFPELDFFPSWIASGRAGDMHYLESRNEDGNLKRSSLQNAVPWARSVVVCAINYNTKEPYSTESTDSSRGWISRYAWSKADYNDVVLDRLRQLEKRFLAHLSSETIRTWCYVDTGPLIERVFAKYAGIGWVGKNTCVINQRIGSWLFLGVMLTSLDLKPDLPAADRCGTCTRCLDACPTNAFLAPHQLDATRCISYLTIEKRGEIPEDLREGMGRHVFGCDICQDVCPWNRKSPATQHENFAPRPDFINPELTHLATISEENFRTTFRGSPIKRTKRSGLRRNAVVAMGNSGNPNFIALLEELSRDADENVAKHAKWAEEKLRKGSDGEK